VKKIDEMSRKFTKVITAITHWYPRDSVVLESDGNNKSTGCVHTQDIAHVDRTDTWLMGRTERRREMGDKTGEAVDLAGSVSEFEMSDRGTVTRVSIGQWGSGAQRI
jgi:hypothetical protein